MVMSTPGPAASFPNLSDHSWHTKAELHRGLQTDGRTGRQKHTSEIPDQRMGGLRADTGQQSRARWTEAAAWPRGSSRPQCRPEPWPSPCPSLCQLRRDQSRREAAQFIKHRACLWYFSSGAPGSGVGPQTTNTGQGLSLLRAHVCPSPHLL